MDFFEDLIAQAATSLKPYGFVKSGTKFYLREENIGVIEVQKSQGNTSDLVQFTINLGIYSPKIARTKLLRFDKVTRSPNSWSCHWNNRIGFFFGDKRDYWWKVDLLTTKQDIIKDVLDKLVNVAAPNIKARMKDKSLIDLWEVDNPTNETVIKKSTLLKLTGRNEELRNYLETIMPIKRDDYFQTELEEHIRSLESI